MNPSNEFFRALDSAEPLEPNHHAPIDSTPFICRAAIVKLICSMITTHPEPSYPVAKFSQYATYPETIHFDSVFGISNYLYGTRDVGLTHTRPKQLTWGEVVKHMHLRSYPTDKIGEHIPKENLQTLYGYSDAESAIDIWHCHSFTDMVFFLAGAVVAWRYLVPPTIALSTSDWKFLAANNTGRLVLFIRTVLDELRQQHCVVTNVFEDNDACRMIADSTAPTRQMRHITVREFTLQDWKERYLIALPACTSNANESEMFTKKVGKILCARHNYHISGSITFFLINPWPSSCTHTSI
jgi:hypothetical protein